MDSIEQFRRHEVAVSLRQLANEVELGVERVPITIKISKGGWMEIVNVEPAPVYTEFIVEALITE